MKKLRFLLADDDEDDRDFFEKKLHELAPAANIQVVTNGREAIDYLTRCGNDQLPCAVILDYNMPQMNGPEVLDWLCNRPWFNGVTKFVWSTAYDKEYIDGCKNKGALEYFLKPISEDGLTDMLQQLLAYCE